MERLRPEPPEAAQTLLQLYTWGIAQRQENRRTVFGTNSSCPSGRSVTAVPQNRNLYQGVNLAGSLDQVFRV
jgi:hypothetical protein